MRYLLGSGYHYKSMTPMNPMDFSKVWMRNILNHSGILPIEVVVIASDGRGPVLPRVKVIVTGGDLGHIRDKHEGRKNHHFVGWTLPMLITALMAYNAELDYVFQEQDCLGFNGYVSQMNSECPPHGMLIGRPLKKYPMPATQSLFLVRHSYIPTFVTRYMGYGEDNNKENQGEKKMGRLRIDDPDRVKFMSFGVDRDRPMPYDSKSPWYAQQFTPGEIRELNSLGMI